MNNSSSPLSFPVHLPRTCSSVELVIGHTLVNAESRWTNFQFSPSSHQSACSSCSQVKIVYQSRERANCLFKSNYHSQPTSFRNVLYRFWHPDREWVQIELAKNVLIVLPLFPWERRRRREEKRVWRILDFSFLSSLSQTSGGEKRTNERKKDWTAHFFSFFFILI